MEETGILMTGRYFGKQSGSICKHKCVHLLHPKNSTLFILSGGNNYKILTFRMLGCMLLQFLCAFVFSLYIFFKGTNA